MGLFNRRKLNKIKRTEVVDAIIELNKQQDELTAIKSDNEKKIDALFKQGKMARDKQEQLWCAKQINVLKQENKATINRLFFLTSNISALNQLKNAIDDKEFLKGSKNAPLNKILSNTGDLSAFLKKINSQKMYNEDIMANTLEVFDDVNGTYEGNERIYGESQSDNQLLAMFEYSSMDDMEKGQQETVKQETSMFEDDNQEQETRKAVSEDEFI